MAFGERQIAAEQPAQDVAASVGADDAALAPSRAADSSEKAGRTNWWPILGCLGLFLLGYLLASIKTDWEHRRLVEGTVAHYGLWKGLRPGVGERLRQIVGAVAAIHDQLRRLPVVENKRPEEAEKKTASEESTPVKDRKLLVRRLMRLHQELSDIEARYARSKEETVVLAKILADKLAELPGQTRRRQAAEKPTDDPSNASSYDAGSAGESESDADQAVDREDSPREDKP